MVIRIHRDKNLLALMGKKKRLVRILATTETGAVVQYEPLDEIGNTYMPLIENGKNVEDFEIVGEQMSLL